LCFVDFEEGKVPELNQIYSMANVQINFAMLNILQNLQTAPLTPPLFQKKETLQYNIQPLNISNHEEV